jgi:hypothetical protein
VTRAKGGPPVDPGRRAFLRRVAGAAGVVAGAGVARPVLAAGARDPVGAGVAVEWMRLLCDQVRAERVSPPVASRVFAYAGVALYEAAGSGRPDHVSLTGQLREMPPMPAPAGPPPRREAAAAAAVATVAAGVSPWWRAATRTAFAELLRDQRARWLARGEAADPLEASLRHGTALGEAVLGWAAGDGFAATRGLSYDPPVGPGRWVPTPPERFQALEPYWGTLRLFTLDSPTACPLPPPAPHSAEAGSDFHRQAARVYEAVRQLTTERLEIARFWADNPGETATPPGHWVALECQLATDLDLGLDEAADLYARVGVALADAFIACWHAKYAANVIRPVTYIRQHIDPRWGPLLMTPPFPEYPSGHSVASGAAAEVLTDRLGARPFIDRTHDGRRLRARSFASFHAAAEEAGLSRLYAGIHYPMAIDEGLQQGRCIGRRVNALRTRRGRA